MALKIMVIPDTQVTPESNTDHLEWAGRYAASKKPDVIVHTGDHFDMASLSSYDKGRKSFEGRRILNDLEAGKAAFHRFLKPIRDHQEFLVKNHKKRWSPRLIITLGNHCHRITRAIEASPELEGFLSLDDLGLVEMGWEVYPFLQVVTVGGVAFSHYFTSGVMGRPVSSAKALLDKKHMSCVMGHVQDRNIAYARRADGTSMTGLFAGIFYQENFDYLGEQNNDSWRGIWVLHSVEDGSFDEMPVSLDYLRRKYGSRV